MGEPEKNINDIEGKLENYLDDFKNEIDSVKNIADLGKVKTKYTGKKSFLVQTLKNIGKLPKQLKPLIGKKTNIASQEIESILADKEKIFKRSEYEKELLKESLDLSLPGRNITVGKKNIITRVLEEIEDIFIGLGFDIADGPEVETDYYNFEALNTPAEHPARSLHDTFFISDDVLLLLRLSSEILGRIFSTPFIAVLVVYNFTFSFLVSYLISLFK